MKTKQSTLALLLASAGVSWAAVSLDITKVPVGGTVTGGIGAGPVPQDPDALTGQWFQKAGVRTHEFHDNAVGSGGGSLPMPDMLPSSTRAIKGVASNIVYLAGQGTPIISFSIDATITNDTGTEIGQWVNGNNSHGENQTATVAYVGTMYQTMLVAEFALTSSGLQPPLWAPPYTQYAPEILAANEDDAAWYCYNYNQGNYYVPAWNFGDIGAGQTVAKTLNFTVNGPTGPLLPTDPRYTALVNSQANGLDILSNRTTSLKISNWLDTIAVDTGVPYPHLSGGGTSEEALLSSNASVFHIVPEASSSALLALAGLLALRRRRA